MVNFSVITPFVSNMVQSSEFILMYERERIKEVEAESAEIRQVRRNINMVHRRITRLALLGEGVIGWNEEDCRRYHTQRLCADSLFQDLKSQCTTYVHTEQIGTLRSL